MSANNAMFETSCGLCVALKTGKDGCTRMAHATCTWHYLTRSITSLSCYCMQLAYRCVDTLPRLGFAYCDHASLHRHTRSWYEHLCWETIIQSPVVQEHGRNHHVNMLFVVSQEHVVVLFRATDRKRRPFGDACLGASPLMCKACSWACSDG
jgi:hypothetical protein